MNHSRLIARIGNVLGHEDVLHELQLTTRTQLVLHNAWCCLIHSSMIIRLGESYDSNRLIHVKVDQIYLTARKSISSLAIIHNASKSSWINTPWSQSDPAWVSHYFQLFTRSRSTRLRLPAAQLQSIDMASRNRKLSKVHLSVASTSQKNIPQYTQIAATKDFSTQTVLFKISMNLMKTASRYLTLQG